MVDFVEICNVCARKATIEAAKRIINSEKVCHSYSYLNFGVTFFWNTVYIDKFEVVRHRRCRYELSRTEWTEDSVINPQNGVDNITIVSYQQMTSMSSFVTAYRNGHMEIEPWLEVRYNYKTRVYKELYDFAITSNFKNYKLALYFIVVAFSCRLSAFFILSSSR